MDVALYQINISSPPLLQETQNQDVLEAFPQLLAWLESHVLPHLRTQRTQKRRQRRLLNTANATLLDEPSGDPCQLSQTLPQVSDMMTMSQTMLMSQTLLSETLIGQKRPAVDDRTDLAVQLIVVCCVIWYEV